LENQERRLEWINMSQYSVQWWHLVNKTTKIQVPQTAENFTSWAASSFSRRTLLHGVSYWSVTLIKLLKKSSDLFSDTVRQVWQELHLVSV